MVDYRGTFFFEDFLRNLQESFSSKSDNPIALSCCRPSFGQRSIINQIAHINVTYSDDDAYVVVPKWEEKFQVPRFAGSFASFQECLLAMQGFVQRKLDYQVILVYKNPSFGQQSILNCIFQFICLLRTSGRIYHASNNRKKNCDSSI